MAANFRLACSGVRMRQTATSGVSGIALPTLGILIRRRGLRVMTHSAVTLGPFLPRFQVRRGLYSFCKRASRARPARDSGCARQ